MLAGYDIIYICGYQSNGQIYLFFSVSCVLQKMTTPPPGRSLEAEELCREKLRAGKMGQAAQAQFLGWTAWKDMEPLEPKSSSGINDCEHMEMVWKWFN